jgi:hypothetical protein
MKRSVEQEYHIQRLGLASCRHGLRRRDEEYGEEDGKEDGKEDGEDDGKEDGKEDGEDDHKGP